jgi:protein-tyrosine-phosphatase
MSIEIINLDTDELSDEDKLFYSPMRNKEILLVCEKGNTISVLAHSYLNSKYPDYHMYSAGYNSMGEMIPDYIHDVLEESNLITVKDVSNDIKDYKKIIFKHIIIFNEDNNKVKRDIKPPEGDIYNLNLKSPTDKKETIIVLNKIKEFFEKEDINK